MEIKHTPGPWQFDEVATTCGRAFRIGAGEMLKAGKGCCIIYDDYHGNPENERKANARLIAAAPDLLKAAQAAEQKLIKLRSILSDRGIVAPCTDEIVKLQEAMVKAGG